MSMNEEIFEESDDMGEDVTVLAPRNASFEA